MDRPALHRGAKVAVEVYSVACPRCGYKVESLEVKDIEEDVSEVSVLATCRRCQQVLTQEVPPRRAGLAEYREQMHKAIKHMELARKHYLDNIKRRIEELEPRVHTGEATLAERARFSGAVEASRKTGQADVDELKRTLERIDNALENASDDPVHHTCGEALVLHEETTSGYSIECPHCGEEMVVRLVERR